MASFKKGRQKTGGIKKGGKHKKTLLKVEAYLTEKGISPVEKIIDLLPQLPAHDQIQVWWNILKYVDLPIREIAHDPSPRRDDQSQARPESNDAHPGSSLPPGTVIRIESVKQLVDIARGTSGCPESASGD